MDNNEMIGLIDKAINSIDEVRYLIYKEHWGCAEALFHVEGVLCELKFNMKSGEE